MFSFDKIIFNTYTNNIIFVPFSKRGGNGGVKK